MPSPTAATEESLRAEYAATQEAYLHYDNFSWQVGAVLIAGTFVFWGFLLDKTIQSPSLFIIASFLVASLMSIWMLYAHHNRQIYLSKLHRIHEIEDLLGLEQHRRWNVVDSEDKFIYRSFGPRGHHLDALIYSITSLGAPLIGLFKIGPNPYLILPLALVFGILVWVWRNECALKKHLRRQNGATSDRLD
jgi:hypothetical protein